MRNRNLTFLINSIILIHRKLWWVSHLWCIPRGHRVLTSCMCDTILSALGVPAHQQVFVVHVRSVVPDSLWPRELQPAGLLCPRGLSRQEHRSGLPSPPPSDPGTEPRASCIFCIGRQVLDQLSRQGSPDVPNYPADDFFYFYCSTGDSRCVRFRCTAAWFSYIYSIILS